MRRLTNFYDFRFKWTATAAIGIHPTKAWLWQLVNFKNAIWTWGHFRRTICNKKFFLSLIKDWKKTYIRISSTKWKIRYANHKFSFSHEYLKHQTALFKHFWSLKNKGLTPEIQWSILKKSNTPKCFDSNLCLEEKIQIMTCAVPEKLLNQRCELIARCRHWNKFRL